ncbi:promotilin [Eublepharis macularius]|uniref:Promotilin n=1 Tax=Eublepharis macularius TaxID=481883 RepID=A0AA97L0E8_EUBMA|nr:promotilin [Eublepharis macularius]
MVPRKVMATFLLLYMVAMLAKQSEGFISFFNPGEFERMQARERNQGQKESLTMQKRSDTKGFAKFSEDGQVIKLIAPVEIGIHLNSRQLEKYQDALEELLTEMFPDPQNVN